MILTAHDQQLCHVLRDHPREHGNRYDNHASQHLLESLFSSLTCHNVDYLRLLFPHGPPDSWQLREAQGAVEGAEYTEAARGKPCGHIFKSGEATYRCKTCTLDDTCVLCSKCFDASDHLHHMVYVSVSPGNSGCCDCGDAEAWRLPVNCAIHTADQSRPYTESSEAAQLPQDLAESIRITIGRTIDYMCDVISCSPERLRSEKSVDSIRHDERLSRLTSKWYDNAETVEDSPEYALLLWNDEKHTVDEVKNQLARACRNTMRFGLQKANEVNDMGRSVVRYSKDIEELLKIAKIIEDIKVTVTIRSARDTFREQMCGTIIEWLVDIAGCSIGKDHDILRHTICEEILKSWRTGSEACNATPGRSGIDDHEREEASQDRRLIFAQAIQNEAMVARVMNEESDEDLVDDDNNDGDEDVDSQMIEADEEDDMLLDLDMRDGVEDEDLDMQTAEEPEDETEVSEATYAGYPPPPPPPPPPPQPRRRRQRTRTSSDSDNSDPLLPPSVLAKVTIEIPKTPTQKARISHQRPAKYWLEKPPGYTTRDTVPLYEDIWQRVRLDWMILFDLRLWKKARTDLRDLYISTVVTIPQFKRVLGLRFAGLYTVLAQLYLVSDREPDHSIINLSLQMLTTPSITEEVVERGNFLTNLIAILYTFLTTRQVGHPQDVDPLATLAFDAGSVTNRRMYHFFMDLKYLFGSEYVQEKLRTEERYMLQFLDLVKLPQGICPNTRAIGEHVEYETDAWISASLLTREINRLCRQFAESFRWKRSEDAASISRVIRLAAKTTIINSVGAERKRFHQAEIKDEVQFKTLDPLAFDRDEWGRAMQYEVVNFVVDKEPISFHHALHYTLSWLVDCGKSMSRDELRSLLLFTAKELREPPTARAMIPDHEPEDYLMAMFDFPLRVCAWLAQMKAGMWVRNGLSLRHQMSTYRGVSQRDLAHHRDIFLLQTALVTCSPNRVLASMIDRFGLVDWIKGNYGFRPRFEDTQLVDVAEDLIHLLIVLLSDRTSLQPIEDEPYPQTLAIRKDIVHILCFKPLSFSDLCGRLADKFQDLEEFQDILDEMTNFRSPESLSDSGTFELAQEFLEELDPYIAHYSKNQRDEAENVYRSWKAKTTGKPLSAVVYEPKLRPIDSGVFADLAAFTRSPLFAQTVYYSLAYAVQAKTYTPTIPSTRVEAFIQVVLHLTLLAILEDRTDEDEMTEESLQSFTFHALSKSASVGIPGHPTIFALLQALLFLDELKSCAPKIHLALRRLQQKRPRKYRSISATFGVPSERIDTESPASAAGDDAERKKKQALERQAKVMAQFQQQQQRFLDNQGDIDWGDEDPAVDDSEEPDSKKEHRKFWTYPSGTCILCQEETNDARLFGTFALIKDSDILRQTDLKDPSFVSEAIDSPKSLDRSADDIRPFGVSGENRNLVRKLTATGEEVFALRQGLGKGFPPSQVKRGPVTVGCGHIMHYTCFELYYAATQRRQAHQIARNHPERLARKEFVCPLCKALGNAFLPIIWRGKEEVYPGVLHTDCSMNEWLQSHVALTVSRFQKSAVADHQNQANARYQELFVTYASRAIIPPLANKLDQLVQPHHSNPILPNQPGPFQMPGIFPNEDILTMTSPSHAIAPQAMAMVELVGIYKRLCETFRVNQLTTRYNYPTASAPALEDLTNTDTLAKTLGFSIAATEIAQRGIESASGSTLLDKIPQQTLTHLRILSETAFSYIAIGGLRNVVASKTVAEFSETHIRQLHQLWFGHPQIFGSGPSFLDSDYLQPLLSQDLFNFLAECSVCIIPAFGLDVHHVLQLCYIAEIVKVAVAFLYEPEGLLQLSASRDDTTSTLHGSSESRNSTATESLLSFLNRILTSAEVPITARWKERVTLPTQQLRRLLASYALPFLRKSVILLHVSYGLDFPNTGSSDTDVTELDRLTSALRLPTVDDICSSLDTEFTVSTVLQSVVAGWVRHWAWNRLGKRPGTRTMSLSHPVIFELIGLPHAFDTLTDETMRRKCPTTGKELVDPTICLFCGDIFCSQAFCCQKGKLGGCNQHLEK